MKKSKHKSHKIPTIVYVSIFITIVLSGCYALSKPPERACPIKGLVMNDGGFPPDSRFIEVFSPDRAAYEVSGSIVSTPLGPSVHNVFRYKTAKRAKEKYDALFNSWFNWFSPDAGWDTPDYLSFRSEIADIYYVSCGFEFGTYRCSMMAQYQEYLIQFTMPMVENSEQWFKSLNQILYNIDDKMVRCFEREVSK